VTVRGYGKVKKGDEEALKEAIFKYGPVAFTSTCTGRNFMFYKKGVFHDKSPKTTRKLNHAMIMVGYGTSTEPDGRKLDYWIVKNSYGVKWGEKGYIRMIRNVDNNCDVASDAFYPII
jgi:C1A family cysteine protease